MSDSISKENNIKFIEYDKITNKNDLKEFINVVLEKFTETEISNRINALNNEINDDENFKDVLSKHIFYNYNFFNIYFSEFQRYIYNSNITSNPLNWVNTDDYENEFQDLFMENITS